MVTLEGLKEYCEGKDFELSEHAEKIYEALQRRDGNCPCRVENHQCPCVYHLKEIEDKGHCHCNLFIKKSD